MYLKELTIKKFRSISELTLSFNKGLNVIIGENNSGKSAVIDALRICLSLGRQSREIYVKEDEDFYLDTLDPDYQLSPIEFGLRFEVEDALDRAYFATLMWQDPDDPS